ncbi:MAG: hypothetical protein SFV81_20940 [Pirellulaceae bacterium]|nr:hypothetical protein [Pirellulaceae bacterium]
MKTVRFATFSLTLCIATLCIASYVIAKPTTLWTQDPFDPFGSDGFADPFGMEEGVEFALEPNEEGQVATVSAEPQEDARKKERLDAINALTFDRRPSAILKLWSERGKQPAEPETELEPEPAPADPKAAANPAETAAPKVEVAADPNAPPKVETPEEKAAAEAKAQAEAKAKAAAEAKEKKRFSALLTRISETVTLGEWDKFAKLIGNRKLFSEPESTALYNRLLDQLGSQMGMDFSQVEGMSKEMRQFMQSMMGDQRNNPGQAYVEKHSINFADLIAMIRSAPSELTDEEVVKLAKLLRRTLGVGNQLDDFVATLKSEGDKLLPKQKAALLLSSASQDQFTVSFLPSQEEAIQSKNRQVLNLWARHYLALYDKELKESLREDAWRATLAALDVPALPPEPKASDEDEEKAKSLSDEAKKQLAKEKAFRESDERERAAALARAVSLAPQVRDELGKKWLAESFTAHPERGQEILARIGTSTAQLLSQSPQDSNNRTRNLELQHAAVAQLFATKPEIDSKWRGILNLLAANWLQESQITYRLSGASQFGPNMRRDRYGNIYYASSDEEGAAPSMQMGVINPIKVEQILETAPSKEWFEQIDPSIRPQFTMALCRLWLKVNEDAKAFPYIEQLAATHPDTARELADEFLKVWTSNHNPNAASQRTNYYMFMYGYEQKADKIPLTRSKQDRNLKELAEWLSRLRALPIKGELKESLLVDAFMTCHSAAEVYDIEDIEKVFGAWDSIEAGTMASLIQKMRANLGEQWRDPNIQRDAKSNRKKNDIQAEVVRGYAVARRVLDKAIEHYPGDWQLLLAKACVMHDENDYMQEVSPSSEFSARRQAAFDVFAAAASTYVKIVPDLPERKQNTEVFDHWFYAALGAADLKGISEKNRPATEQFDLIAASMNTLTGEIGKRHRDRFANALFTRMSAVSPSCKFRYVEGGFKLVGDNPQAEEARKVYNYYKDLVTEIQLVARIDGNTQVGHDQPFGVYIDLKHSKEIERESSGFAKYLQNQNNMFFAYNYGRPTENYRDKFQDATKLALEEHFDVLSITFNHAETKSIATESAGWRVTPYAYLLVKARGPEVDKLPALKMDLDFLDTSGYVVLPISSAPIPIDAASKSTANPASEVKLVQVLDERQSKEGKLIVEAKATARGLVPTIDNLLDVKIEGFELSSNVDSGVSVIEFDKESTTPIVLSERTWTLKYSAADPAAPAPKSFVFPAPLVETKDLSYQRYVDADLQEVEPTVALVADYGSNRRAWIIGSIFAVTGLSLLIVSVVAVRRMSSRVKVTNTVAEQPTTPFTLLTRLQNFAADPSLSSDKQSRLREDIAAIEKYYFAESANGQSRPDLSAMANRWR